MGCEVQGLAGQRKPLQAGVRLQAQPLPHRRSLVRVEVHAVTSGDERVDALSGKLQHQPAADQHDEDLVLETQAGPAEAASAPWRGNSGDTDEFVSDSVVTIFRRGRVLILLAHRARLTLRGTPIGPGAPG